jgi:hypothetical protein
MARTDEAKWKRTVAAVKAGDKGGKPGKWSARKAQLATQRYKKSGGDWGTKSGKPSTQGPKATGERYLPKAARQALTASEYSATSKAKREGTKAGKQFVKQPAAIAKKTARHR